VLETTRLAKRYGFQVRFYMMWGNRGENRDTIRESLDLIAAAQPNQVLFTLLSIYPGTEEFEVLRREGAVTEEFFFAEDFPTLKLFQGEARQFKDIQERVSRFERHIDFWRYGVEEYEEILSRLPDLPEAHLDLAAACCRAGKREQTEHHVREALERGYPLPGLAINVRGCLAASQGQFEQARRHFVEALQHYPHAIVQENLGVLTAWLSLGGPASGRPLLLRPDACFETCWPEQQPEKPVPFSGRWDTAMLAH
jgi:tetratricopeptide (TPR) repeat protein